MEKWLFKPMEVSKLLRIEQSQIDEMLAKGFFKTVRVGRSIRICLGAPKEWIESRNIDE
ncbi:hypothetical protein ACFLU3_00120 [Chloroflexota bacterium]